MTLCQMQILIYSLLQLNRPVKIDIAALPVQVVRCRNQAAAFLSCRCQNRSQRHFRHSPFQVIVSVKGNRSRALHDPISGKSGKCLYRDPFLCYISVKIHNVQQHIPPFQVHGVSCHIHS